MTEFLKLYNTYRNSEREVRDNIYRVIDLVDDRVQNGSFTGHIDGSYVSDDNLIILVSDEQEDYVYHISIPLAYFNMTDDQIIESEREKEKNVQEKLDFLEKYAYIEYPLKG